MTIFNDIGIGFEELFTGSRAEESRKLIDKLLEIKTRSEKFKSHLSLLASDIDKFNASYSELKKEIETTFGKIHIDANYFDNYRAKFALSLGLKLTLPGCIFAASWGCGKLATSNISKLENLVRPSGGLDMTAAGIAKLNTNLANTSTKIVNFTRASTLLRTVGRVFMLAGIVLTLIEAHNFGKEMRENVEKLTGELNKAKEEIEKESKSLEKDFHPVKVLSIVLSGDIFNSPSNPTLVSESIIIEAKNGEKIEKIDVNNMLKDLIYMMKSLDSSQDNFDKIDGRVTEQLNKFNLIMGLRLVEVKAALKTLKSNVVSAVKLLDYDVSDTKIKESLKLSDPMMAAIQEGIKRNILKKNGSENDFCLSILADASIRIDDPAHPDPSKVISTNEMPPQLEFRYIDSGSLVKQGDD
jgi:hypothetical protein